MKGSNVPCVQATRSTRYTLTFSIIIIVGYVIKVCTVQASCQYGN